MYVAFILVLCTVTCKPTVLVKASCWKKKYAFSPCMHNYAQRGPENKLRTKIVRH